MDSNQTTSGGDRLLHRSSRSIAHRLVVHGALIETKTFVLQLLHNTTCTHKTSAPVYGIQINRRPSIHQIHFFFVLYINIYIYHHPNRSYTALFDMYRSVFFYRRTIRSRKNERERNISCRSESRPDYGLLVLLNKNKKE